MSTMKLLILVTSELERGQEEGGDCADEASVLPQLPAAQTLSPHSF